MNKIVSQLESLLLMAGKPVAVSALAKLLAVDADEVTGAVAVLRERYNGTDSGIRVMVNGGKVQLSTNPDHRKLIADFIKDETTGELTKPSLETLTIIAYRQPVTKEELEQIRGVNCSLIIRNLLIRGLIEPKEERGGLATTYSVTMDFLRYLGIQSVEELPDYEKLHDHERLRALLTQGKAQEATQ